MNREYKTCPYNNGIKCKETDIGKCHECGWNPKVEILRKEMIKNGLPCLFSANAAKNE